MMNSKEILLQLTELFSSYLEELSLLKRTEFIHGEMTAYVECLEIISEWKDSNVCPNIAKKYNI